MNRLNVGILTVGNEVLAGIVLDTNSHWMASNIAALGGTVEERFTVQDDPEAISKAIQRLLSDKLDLVITTGGLGPTFDDITIKSLAEALQLPLEENHEAFKAIQERYKLLFDRGRVPTPDMTPAREKMAWLPRGARIIQNPVGTAPGICLLAPGTESTIITLPGVPSELKAMFEGYVVQWLQKRIGSVQGGYAQRVIRLTIRDESLFSPVIDRVSKAIPSVYIKSMAKAYGGGGLLRVWVSSRQPSYEEAQQIVDKAIHLIEQELGLTAEEDKE